MHDAIVDLLDKVDAALAESRGVVPDADLEHLTRIRGGIEARLGHPADILLVGLAGGTGSGKSSLLNAMAGEEIAEVGGIRPTTYRPLGLVSSPSAPLVERYLNDLGLDPAIGDGLPRWLCLVDLPDTDSLALSHREAVESLLPCLDVVVWVVDPEKYGDAALHTSLIGPMSPYQPQFVFAFNQIDRVAAGDRQSVIADFVGTLQDTGIEAPVVVSTSASPPSGPPEGVDRLLAALESLRARDPVHIKLLTDLRQAASALASVPTSAGPPDPMQSWSEVRGAVASSVVDGDPSTGGQQLGDFLESFSATLGSADAEKVRELSLSAPEVAEHAARLVDGGSERHTGRRRFPRRRGREAPPPTDDLDRARERVEAALEGEVGVTLREVVDRRSRSQAAIVDLYVSVMAVDGP